MSNTQDKKFLLEIEKEIASRKNIMTTFNEKCLLIYESYDLVFTIGLSLKYKSFFISADKPFFNYNDLNIINELNLATRLGTFSINPQKNFHFETFVPLTTSVDIQEALEKIEYVEKIASCGLKALESPNSKGECCESITLCSSKINTIQN